ncbi:related to ATP-dependent DNA helicase II, 80 kDa subunit (KU autoantigen protein P86) [Phialocephala subalpina]|uniref:ATP-dependent DNA helicase II subunit 2 n=1 Tax=Phialocephala subalpina TaxID=576137 RepID=A0A1L7WNP6_9HELO|nr:related to ATP-dependent DNA helicase II, 80 kDa subunit (KU autoantigen protein P86) [Phialocephala subalpina]
MSKEATVYVLDLGSTMGDCHSGRVETDLEYAMRYVYDKMADSLAVGRVGLNTGVVAFRTDETDNPLGDDEGYANISVLQQLVPMTMAQFNDLRTKITPSETEGGDAISAIIVAMDMIEKKTTLKTGKPGKWARKIILMTDGQGSIEDDHLEDIVTRIKEMGVELTVLGVDFDDLEFGFKEEDKSSVKKENEALLRKFTEDCDGLYGTALQAIKDLAIPKVKEFRPYSMYTGRLCLGNPETNPDESIYINVKRFSQTKIARPVAAKSYVMRSGGEASTQSSYTLPGDVEMTDAPTEFSAVKQGRSYTIKDPSDALGKRDVDFEDLARGYEYGRTAVHISQSEENVTSLNALRDFSILGFIPIDKYEKYFTMGESCMTIAQTVDDKSRLAFSSLVHALYELESYAIARIVVKDMKDPRIVLLAPYIENHMEGLIDVPLPFAEDVRMFRFPPLDRVISASGTALEKHRYLPSNNLDSAMSDYVDSMDLSTFGMDDEGNPAEYMEVDDTFSPIVHRINQAIRQKAIYDGDISEPAEILTKWSEPPTELVTINASKLESLIAAADVKKVPPKVKGKRNRREIITPLSGLDVDALLKGNKPKKISKENAIAEFKQILEDAESDNAVLNAVNQMSDIIRDLIKGSTGDSDFDRAQENIKVLREEMVDYEFPGYYNNFFKDLRKRLMKGELGGRRQEFWVNLKKARLGLIDNTALPTSDVSPEEATEFWLLSTELPTRGREN